MSSDRDMLNSEKDSACLGVGGAMSADGSEKTLQAEPKTKKETSAESSSTSSSRVSETEATDDSHMNRVGAQKTDPGDEILEDLNTFWQRPSDQQFIERFYEERGKMTPKGCYISGDNLWNFFMNFRAGELLNEGKITSGDLAKAHMLRSGKLASSADVIKDAPNEHGKEQLHPLDIGVLVCGSEHLYNGQCPTYTDSLPILRQRLPLHLLPQKLTVHDPWGTLYSHPDPEKREPHKNDDDSTFTYVLHTSSEGNAKVERDREAAENGERDRVEREKDEWRVFYPKCNEDGTTLSNYAIHAKVPPRLTRPTSVLEADLWIHRSNRIGSGNHSVVYDVQLEVPRWVVCEDVLCESCWWTAFNEAMAEHAAADTNLSEEETSKSLAPEAMLESRTDGSHVVSPGEGHDGAEYVEKSPQHGSTHEYATMKEEFSGPVVRIYPKIEWQRPGVTAVCKHVALPGRGAGIEGRPATARVRVCAKLSALDDAHLQTEAHNYQDFTTRFYTHWSGYKVVGPLRNPTARGAVVPQFYGYYIVHIEQSSTIVSEGWMSEFCWSPLLLMENCGQPIDVNSMSEDEREECASLYFKMLNQRWTQGSIYARNVLCQEGPVTEYPPGRAALTNKKRVFRLIDFGRARKFGNNWEQCDNDERDILNLLKVKPRWRPSYDIELTDNVSLYDPTGRGGRQGFRW